MSITRGTRSHWLRGEIAGQIRPRGLAFCHGRLGDDSSEMDAFFSAGGFGGERGRRLEMNLDRKAGGNCWFKGSGNKNRAHFKQKYSRSRPRF